MKPKHSLLTFLALAGSSLLAVSSASANTLYWDGNNTSANADGGTGTWINGTTTNWDTLSFGGSDSVWTNGDLAVFGGEGATVTIGAGGVSVGGLTFNSTYTLNAGTNGLTFSSGTNVIQSYIGANGDTSSTITGTVGGGSGANITLRSGADQRLYTLNLNGTSAGGWGGTTTLNAGTRVNLSASNQALLNTSAVSGPAITLNGGNILLTNANNATEAALDRVNDSAAIASYGSGSILMANTAAASRVYSESIGSVTHYNGQLNLGFTTVQNQTGNTQTLMLGGLTNSGSTSTVAISSGGSGAGSIHGNSNIRVNGITTSTPAGEIVGPWLTAGSAAASQSDWAVYNSDGVSGRVQSANISGSAQTTWTSTTGNYTAAMGNPTVATTNNRLTADRMVNTMRATFAESASTAFSFDLATETVTFTGHTLTDGDVVHFRNAPSGLTNNRPYYVVNSATDTFQLSLTPSGSVVNLTNAAAGFMSTGLNLNGNTLGMNGYITGTTGTAAIGGGSASTITLPTTTSGNLHLHGAANIWIDPSIKNNDPLSNGSGVLTLVKSGAGTTVTLSGNNTYTGGTVINSGTINFATAGSWVSGQNLTFGGAGRIDASVGALSGGTLDIDQGAVGVIAGSSAITFSSTTGSGKLNYYGGGVGAGVLNMGDASGFTGDLHISNAGGTNPYPSVTFASIGDAAGSSIQFGGGQGDSNQRAIVALNGSSALILENRQIQLLPRSLGNGVPRRNVLMNNSSNAAHHFVIEQDLLNTTDRTSVELQLDGTNTGNNEFSGDIGDSTYSAAASPSQFALNVYKNGAGKWILSGDNTFTGRLLVSNGTLSVGTFNDSNTAGALGMGSIIQLGGAEASPVTGGSGLASAMVLSGNNSGTLEYTGGVASTTRTFQIGSNATGTHTGGGRIDNNGTGALTFTATNFNDAISGVTATRTLTLGGSNTGANEIQGIIRDNVLNTGKINVTKADSGTWVLSGDNTYTGTTTVSAGKLIINGNSSVANGDVTVAAAGTIGGIGTVGGNTALNGTLSPGQSPGTLTFAGNLAVNNGATYFFEGGDLTVIDGALDLNDNWTLSLGLNLQDGGAVVIFEYGTLAASPDLVPTFDLSSLGFTPSGALTLFDDTVNNAIVLQGVSVIPEPGAALLGSLGILLIFRRRRN